MGYQVTRWIKDPILNPSVSFLNYRNEECHVIVGVSHSSEPLKDIRLYMDTMHSALSRRPDSKVYFASVQVLSSYDDFKNHFDLK